VVGLQIKNPEFMLFLVDSYLIW